MNPHYNSGVTSRRAPRAAFGNSNDSYYDNSNSVNSAHRDFGYNGNNNTHNTTLHNRSSGSGSGPSAISIEEMWTRNPPKVRPMSSDNDTFSSRFAVIRSLISWLEEQQDVLNKLMTQAQFEKVEPFVKQIQSDIIEGFHDLQSLLDYKTNPSDYSQDKARLNSIQQQYKMIEMSVNKSVQKIQRHLKVKRSREQLFGSNEWRKNRKKQLSRADELSSLQSSHSMIDDTLQMVTDIKNEMFQQSTFLKGTKRKLLDMTNLVGLSNSLVRVIGKRSTVDRWILFGGMFLTLLVIFLLWYYFL